MNDETPMADSLIERAGEIFCDAMEIEAADERNRYVERTCDGDAGLLGAVRELLEGKAGADAFFHDGCPTQLTADECVESLSNDPAFREASHAVLPPERKLGQCIGPYRLLQKIGEGGGGSVYLAEQGHPVQRQVALKVLRPGTDTQRVITRFEAERQVLAMMEHVHIAHVLDAGATDDGVPYFVMELVHGVRITEYCDAHHLDIPHRVELFIEVCHAIQHAHHKGVLHRDIKPSNILIAMQDGAPVPKVIDFGVAKAVSGPLPAEDTTQTLRDHFVGTPAYMSPEQAGLGNADVDVRSDIYSLGVLLYELLVGEQPFDRKDLLGSGLDEMLRTLREREPPRPSARLLALGADQLSETAHGRQVEPRRLVTLLHGDLDWIVMKALEKDRDRRYQTVDGLAEDVQRYLRHEPVVARPPSRRYRFRKLVYRNKGVFASVAAVGLALSAGFGTSWWLYLRERELKQEQARLLVEAETREKITQAAVLLQQGRPEEADQLVAASPIPVIRPSLEAAGVFRQLGFWNVTRGRFSQAADRYLKLLEANKVDKTDLSDTATRDLLAVAPVLVATGDIETYDRIVQEALTRFAGTRNPVAAEQLIKISVILPLDEARRQSVKPLADVVASSISQSPAMSEYETFLTAWRTYALAGLAYRLRSYEQAVTWGNRSLSYGDSSQTRVAMTHLVLAMAHHQLGHAETARLEFERGSAAVRARFPDGPARVLEHGDRQSGRWSDWLSAHFLMREAEKLLHGTPDSGE